MSSLSTDQILRPLTEYEPPLNLRLTALNTQGSPADASPTRQGGHHSGDHHSRWREPNRDAGDVGLAELELPTSVSKRVRAILAAILEAQAGIRTPGQLRGVMRPGLYQRLFEEGDEDRTRYILGAIHTSQPDNRTIDVSGIVRAPERFLALSARFEYARSSWRCTLFTVLIPGCAAH